MAEIPIEIRIKAIVEGAPEVADLVNNLEKLKNLSGDLGEALAKSGEEGRRATDAMGGISDLSPKAREVAESLRKIRDVGVQDHLIEVAKSSNTLSEFLRRAGIEAKYLGEEISKTQERLVSAAQSSGVYFKGLENVSVAMRDQSTLMSFRKQLLDSLTTSDRNKVAATQYLTRELHGNAQAASGLVNAYTTLQGAGNSLQSVQDHITASMNTATQSGITHNQILRYLGPSYAQLMRYVGMSKNEILDFQRALSQGVPIAETELANLIKVRRALKGIAMMQREYKAQLGATGVALKDFSRDIFWTGLGIMFTTMSIARTVRMYAQLQDISYNLAQASMSIKEAEDAYREALALEGPVSEEAISARRRLVEAQYRETQVRRQSADAIRQYNLSLGMLIFGMMPTAMRTAHTFGDLFTKLGIIQAWSGDQAVGAGAKQLMLAGAQDKASASSFVQGVTTRTTGTAISLAGDAAVVTAGKMYALEAAERGATIGAIGLKAALGDVIGLAIFAAGVVGTYAYANWQAEESMKAFDREAEKWRDELGYGTSSLDDLIGGSGLIEATQRTKEFTSALQEMPRIEKMTVTTEMESIELEPIPEEISQLIIQELIPVKIEEPSSMTQLMLIEQILEEVEIPLVENLYQSIIQILKEIEIESPKDETQLITQQLRSVEIPIPEDLIQTITQRLMETEIEKPEDIEMAIYQVLEQTDIPEIRSITQEIFQQLRMVEIPKVEDQKQKIEQFLTEVKIPLPENLIQTIFQQLQSVEIEKPEDIEIIIHQILEEVDIPEKENLQQMIVQRLEEVEIPTIDDKRQIITQSLEKVMIPIPESLKQIIKQELLEVDTSKPEDYIQTITQILTEVNVPTEVESLTQNIVQNLEEIEVSRVEDQEQIIRQTLEEVEISIPEDIVQIITQRLEEVSISEPNDIYQVIYQSLEEAHISEVEDITQRITQELEKVLIPEVENQEQMIIQSLEQVTIPLPEDILQRIIQKLESVEITEPKDYSQIITQSLIEADIPNVENITQTISQRLETIRIPSIQDKEQMITQSLEEVFIPLPEDVVQVITQKLEDVEITKPEDYTQVISQVLIEADLPKVEDLTQRIVQNLERIEIPQIENQEQIITQSLQQVTIPLPDNIIQTITQKLESVEITEPEDYSQVIKQSLIEANIPRVEDVIQKIVQELETVRIPRVEDKEQIITQSLIEARIPLPENLIQVITQELRSIEIKEPEDFLQIIRQKLMQIEIPEIENIIQTISQKLETVEIPSIEDKKQTIYQALEEVNIPSVINQEQIITQILEEKEIPLLEDVTQTITQAVDLVEIPETSGKEQVITQRLEEMEIPEVLTQEQLINQKLIEAEIPEIHDLDQYIYQHLIRAGIEEPEELTQIVRQEIIGQKLEERRSKLVLTGMDNLIIRNMETTSFEGRDLHMGMGISKWYKVGDLTAENVSGAFGPSAIEIEFLRVIAQQSVLLDWLPHIWRKTGSALGRVYDAMTGVGTTIENEVQAHMTEVKGIGSNLGTDITGVGTNVSDMGTNVTDKIGTQTTLLASPLGELSSISEDTADFVTNLRTIVDLTKGTVGLLADIVVALSAGTSFLGSVIDTIGGGLGTVGGFLGGIYDTLTSTGTIHVKPIEPMILPETPSQTINININNPIVRSEEDIQSLAREVRYQIARGVKVR